MAGVAGADDAADQRALSLEMKPWTGDFSGKEGTTCDSCAGTVQSQPISTTAVASAA